jgi:Golgi apyrase
MERSTLFGWFVILSTLLGVTYWSRATFTDAKTPLDTHLEIQVENSTGKWYRNREFGIVIDAGSSGSRIQIYSWKNTEHIRGLLERNHGKWRNLTFDSMPVIDLGDEAGQEWQFRVEPGISTFGNQPSQLAGYLKPLLDHALKVVPADKVTTTPIFLYATAGMRLLSPDQQAAILTTTCSFIKESTKFLISDCRKHVQVISGEWEGIYGWAAINHLMDGFNPSQRTLGFLDMGGASTQIAFEPEKEVAKEHAEDMLKVALRSLSGADREYFVYVTTFLGYGMNEARRRYVDWLIGQALKENPMPDETATPTKPTRRKKVKPQATIAPEDVEKREEHVKEPTDLTIPDFSQLANNPLWIKHVNSLVIEDHCLPKGVAIDEEDHLPLNLQGKGITTVFKGTGRFLDCLITTIPLLNKNAPCPDAPCLFNGVHIPGGAPGKKTNLHFVGISEYWYTSDNVFGLGGDYAYHDYQAAARKFCGQSWNTTVEKFQKGLYPSVSALDRLELQCFKSAWIVNILHEGLGIPKELLLEEEDDIVPVRSINEINGLQVSWTLGVILLYASGTIPPVGWVPKPIGSVGNDSVPVPEPSVTPKYLLPVAILSVILLSLFAYWLHSRGRREYGRIRNVTELGLSMRKPADVELGSLGRSPRF